MGAGKFRHRRRSGGPIYSDEGVFRSIYVDDGILSTACCAPASRLAFVLFLDRFRTQKSCMRCHSRSMNF
jgi:hypothetical protein